GHEEGFEQRQEDEDEDLLDGNGHQDVASSRGRRRGSRSRAGTPTASLPGGTSRVTTAPAPVFAPSPTSIGAMSMVSTPRKAPLPTRVRFFTRPSQFAVI